MNATETSVLTREHRTSTQRRRAVAAFEGGAAEAGDPFASAGPLDPQQIDSWLTVHGDSVLGAAAGAKAAKTAATRSP